MHHQLHRRFGQRTIGSRFGIEIAERKRRQFMDVRVLRRDDLLERFYAFNAEWVRWF